MMTRWYVYEASRIAGCGIEWHAEDGDGKRLSPSFETVEQLHAHLNGEPSPAPTFVDGDD